MSEDADELIHEMQRKLGESFVGSILREIDNHITLRDVFAGLAMQGMYSKLLPDDITKVSYMIADAMLVERGRVKE